MSDDYSVSSRDSGIARTQRQRFDSQDSTAPRKLTSSLRDALVAKSNNSDVKIEAEEPLTVTQKKVKWFEWNRRYDRIKDIANMLKANGALTPKEEKWLLNLGHHNFNRYCEIGDLLKVPMLSWSGQSGVWNRADRNRVRMQTLKAALHEAMKTADSDTNFTGDLNTIERAIKKAASIRNDLTTAIGGKRRPRLYSSVTRQTLLHPDSLDQKNRRMIANAALARDLSELIDKSPLFAGKDDIDELSTLGTVGPRADIGVRLNKDDVLKAVKPLLDNNLLDTEAVARLRKRLKNPDKQTETFVSHITKITNDPDMAPADRQKVRSLLYLGLAYATDDNFDRFWVQVNAEISPVARLNVNTGQPPRYKALPNLPRADRTTDDVAKTWLSFWEITRNRVKDGLKPADGSGPNNDLGSKDDFEFKNDFKTEEYTVTSDNEDEPTDNLNEPNDHSLLQQIDKDDRKK